MFQMIFFFHEHHQTVNGLDPDQDRQCVGPDLGPNCWQRLSAGEQGKS